MPLDWIARLVHGTLVWKERQRARRGSGPGLDGKPEASDLGARGERLVYWHLRKAGYVIVGRNRRPRRRRGELDMVGWDGGVLAFIEVKTRGSEEAGPAETAVSRRQRQRIIAGAREYIERLKQPPAAYRFDIAGVHWDPVAGYQVRVIKDAYQG